MTDLTNFERITSKAKNRIPVYIVNSWEEIAFRWVSSNVPGVSRVYAKMKGLPEYQSNQTTNVFTEALLEAKEITADEYFNY